MRRADTEQPFVSGGEPGEEAELSNRISARNWQYLQVAQTKEMRKQIKRKKNFKFQQK